MSPFFSLLLAGFLVLDLASAEVTDGSVEKLASGNVDFAVRLYQAVASRTDDNVCLSPFALSSVLSALLSATRGPTREQLSQGLGLSGLDPQTLPGRTGFWLNCVLRLNGAGVIPVFRSVPESEDRHPAEHGCQSEAGRGCPPFQ